MSQLEEDIQLEVKALRASREFRVDDVNVHVDLGMGGRDAAGRGDRSAQKRHVSSSHLTTEYLEKAFEELEADVRQYIGHSGNMISFALYDFSVLFLDDTLLVIIMLTAYVYIYRV